MYLEGFFDEFRKHEVDLPFYSIGYMHFSEDDMCPNVRSSKTSECTVDGSLIWTNNTCSLTFLWSDNFNLVTFLTTVSDWIQRKVQPHEYVYYKILIFNLFSAMSL
jgi:hypothetical protein